MNASEFYFKIKELLEANQYFAIATIIEAKGSTPRKTGAKMIIFPDQTIIDSVGGGTLEALVIQEAQKALREGKSKTCEFDLYPGGKNPTGAACGGKVSVFIEVPERPPRLLIFGAGHIGFYLARYAGDFGFKVTVIDERQQFANPQRFPQAEIILTDSKYKKNFPKIDSATWIVIVTHSLPTDEAVLRRTLNSKAAYIGMIGSRRKVKEVKKNLQDDFGPELLDKIYAPIGLDLGGDSPPEIALAILAQIIQLKNKR